MILLDTHAFLWFALGEPRLRQEGLLEPIQEALRESSVAVAAITLWEIAMLEAKGRIALAEECHEWLVEALNKTNVQVQPLTPAMACDSARLPGEFRGDPADRLIVATARALGCPLATADARILEYGRQGRVRLVRG